MADALIAPAVDPFTGLPRLPQAVTDIPHLARQHGTTAEALGIVSLFIPPTPALYRMTPEAAQQMRSALTQRLVRALREQDKLYSISHWEWLAVLPALISAAPLTLAMLRIRGALDDPFETLDGDRLQIDGLCGGAFWPDDGDDANHLIQSARIARLHAQIAGSGAEIYRRSMEKTEAGQARFHVTLRQALAGNTPNPMRLHLQPQVSLVDGRCTGAEALLRWPQADGRPMPPQHIIAAMEKLGLRHNYARWLLNQTMQCITTIKRAGIDIPLSINLSASDLLDIELPDLVAQALATWDVPANCLLMEITETMMVAETPQVTEVLRQLRQIGVTLAIDDFGTGYAGMSYLQRLPVQEVKIDQSFVRQAIHTKRDREIIDSIIQLSHRLNLTVVAEGVENQATADMLKTMGCEIAQGNLYAEALPLDDFIHWCQGRPVKAAPRVYPSITINDFSRSGLNMETDLRKNPRFVPTNDIPARIAVEGRVLSGTILNFSATGFAVVLNGSAGPVNFSALEVTFAASPKMDIRLSALVTNKHVNDVADTRLGCHITDMHGQAEDYFAFLTNMLGRQGLISSMATKPKKVIAAARS